MTGTTGIFTSPPQSYWLASTTSTAHPALDSDITVDIAIVGGGLVGITVAYLLKQENLTVAVLEADRIGQYTDEPQPDHFATQPHLQQADQVQAGKRLSSMPTPMKKRSGLLKIW